MDSRIYDVVLLLIAAWCLMVSVDSLAGDRTFYVYGDSLTSPAGSWADLIDDHGYATIRNQAVPGSRLVDLRIPRLPCHNGTEVILWIGTNDAGSNVPKNSYKSSLRRALTSLQEQNCSVTLILPVLVDSISTQVHERTRSVRRWTWSTAVNYSNVTMLDAPYSTENTVDGLHPNAGQQFWIAVWLINELGL
jgi:hypothetical protein